MLRKEHTELGEKKEEYRKIKLHWFVRLVDFEPVDDVVELDEIIVDMNDPSRRHSDVSELLNYFNVRLKQINQIIFSNGFREDRPQFKIECLGIEIKEGNLEWGAVPGVKYFVIKLGEVIE